jgi:hypothetical protein
MIARVTLYAEGLTAVVVLTLLAAIVCNGLAAIGGVP